MTDTNQVNELYELCKRVYELTSWKDTYSRLDDGNHTIRNEGNEVLLGSKQAPLYTSDYLLEKLPDTIGLYREERTPDKWLAACEDGISYGGKHVECGDDECGCESYYGESDTPLKALLKLTIALLEAGRIK